MSSAIHSRGSISRWVLAKSADEWMVRAGTADTPFSWLSASHPIGPLSKARWPSGRSAGASRTAITASVASYSTPASDVTESSRSTLLAASNSHVCGKGGVRIAASAVATGVPPAKAATHVCVDPEAIDCDSHAHDQPFGEGLGDTAHASDTGVPVHDPTLGVRDTPRAKPRLHGALLNESLDLPLERHRAHADVLSSVVKRCFADAARCHAATDGPALVDQHHIDAGVADERPPAVIPVMPAPMMRTDGDMLRDTTARSLRDKPEHASVVLPTVGGDTTDGGRADQREVEARSLSRMTGCEVRT